MVKTILSKRLQDQVLIMGAIRQVKRQLEEAMRDRPESWIEHGEILVRLSTLYSLLDIDRLTRLCVAADVRDQKKSA